jgi:glutamine---fructose-6-phosphate transaminase (isomerizing)
MLLSDQAQHGVARVGKLVLYRYYMNLSETAGQDAQSQSIAPSNTRMFAEAEEASEIVTQQFASNAKPLLALVSRLKALNPDIIFTCARGSSDHAATFAKYLFETELGIPTLSQAPSISSIYGRPLLHMKGQPFFIISQSGRSPDLLASAQAAKKAGAIVIAVVNDSGSPLAQEAEIVVPLLAGAETSVAATKTYIATLAVFVHLVSLWRDDSELINATARLPDILADAWAADWSAGVELLSHAQSAYVLGRGLTLGIAQEAALKLKETCAIHGEAFSLAEVAHGPMALIGPDFPVLVFPPLDQAAKGLDQLLVSFAARAAPIAIAGDNWPDCTALPLAERLHPVVGPLAMIQSFYRLANALSLHRGLNPDTPPMLSKVTKTL